MDFLPVSPLPSIDSNLLETLTRLESSINGLTQQVKVLTKEKNDLTARVDALQKQNLELAAKLQSFTGKRLQETTPTNLPMAPPPKRAVTKNREFTQADGFRCYFEKDVFPSIAEYAKKYSALEETDTPGSFVLPALSEENGLCKSRMRVIETLKKIKNLTSPQNRDVVKFEHELQDTAEFLDVLLGKKEVPIIANRIVRGNRSDKLYSIPDKIVSHILIYAGKPDKLDSFNPMHYFAALGLIIEFKQTKLAFGLLTAMEFAKKNLHNERSTSVKIARFLSQTPNLKFIDQISPGQIVKSAPLPIPDPVVQVPPATPLPDPDQFPEDFPVEEEPEPPLTPYGGV